MDTLQILLVEDDADDVELLRDVLSDSGMKFELQVVRNKTQYAEALNKEEFDVILCDHRLQQFNSLDALRLATSKPKRKPFILISGEITEELAVAVLHAGADDFIFKDRLQRLPFAIRVALDRLHQMAVRDAVEQDLRRSNQRFLTAAKVSFDVIFEYDLQTNELFCSESVTRLFGYPSSENITPEMLFGRVHPEDYRQVQSSIDTFLMGRNRQWKALFRAIKPDGTLVHVRTCALLVKENGRPSKMIGVIHDATAISKLQTKVLQQELEKQKIVAATAVKAQEKERQEIGKELHDNVNQLMATAKLLLESYRKTLDSQPELLMKTVEVIETAIAETRNISHAMMPPSFDDETFLESLRDVVENINLSGKLMVQLEFGEDFRPERLNQDMKLTIYRIAQEQLSNILKHAAATDVLITLVMHPNVCRLVITDNGRGFDQSAKARGIGFSNMSNRVTIINGNLDIISAPGAGCTVKVVFPLNVLQA